MFESSAISKFQKFLNDYHRSFVEAIETKDVSTINLGSGIGQKEFEELLRRKVVNIFQKLWGIQIDKITESRVIRSINIEKLPKGFLDDLDQGIDEWITNDWNPVYAEAVEVAATGKGQIAGLLDKINQSTGISTIFNPNTQRMIDFIDEQGLDLAEKLKVQQKKSLRNTLKRSLKDGWTRDVTISDMKRNVSLTDRESQWLLNYEARQRKALLKEFKERFPKLTENQIAARVENVVQRRKRRKYKFYQRSRSERFYRTELARARNDGNLEALHQATENGAVKNAKKKWVKRNQVDNHESSDKYNGKLIGFDEDFFVKFGRPRETTMLNGKGPGEINELCGLEFFAEKGDGKPKPKVEEISATNFSDAEKQVEEFMKNISDDELDAVKRYTGSDYMRINKYLNSGDESLLGEGDKERIKNIKSFLNRAPKYKGNTYRGKGYWNEKTKSERLEAFKDNKIVTFDCFTSTSVDKSEIELFFGRRPHTIIYKIKSKNGVAISPLSSSPNEKEVLFNVKSKFNVKNITTKGNNTVVSLEEV